MEKVKIITIGITHAKVWFLSMNIFLTAGSSYHAIAEVVPAIQIDKNKQKIILVK